MGLRQTLGAVGAVLVLAGPALAQAPVTCEEDRRTFDLLAARLMRQRTEAEMSAARDLARIERAYQTERARADALQAEVDALKKAQKP